MSAQFATLAAALDAVPWPRCALCNQYQNHPVPFSWSIEVMPTAPTTVPSRSTAKT
jgi:hypothetical protein